jgi:EAL domain-containing protein (putative c-di-GMP-specific phosphodiesterase class I)
LVLHYQPKARVEDGRVLAVEALVRWQHPERGLLYPGDFLLGVEQTELIEPLTRWVLGRALQELPGLDPSGELAVAVNVSARNLTRSEFAGEALAILAESGVQPRRLVLEVTETALLTDPARAADTLHRLADAGVRISIDDFGAGQTSLSYLAALPVAEVKIDKAFVLTMTTDARHAAIVRSVIELGHALGYTVTAEGVETPDTLEQLAAADCDTAQGFLLGRPVPSNELPALLTSVSRSLGVAGSART